MGLTSGWHWLVILVVVVLIFGTRKLRNVGKGLGGAVHDFKKGLNEGTDTENPSAGVAKTEEDNSKQG